MRGALLVLSLGLVGGCACTGGTPHAVAAATPAQQSVLFDRIKGLEGTWEVAPAGGMKGGEIVYSVTAAGSAVREVMFPGSPHEMTNVYHMDGPTLVMTHYCAAGNQPRLRAAPGGAHDPIDLRFDSVTNLRAPDEVYMGHLVLEFVDKDHVRQTWDSYKAGKELEEHRAFDMRRKSKT